MVVGPRASSCGFGASSGQRATFYLYRAHVPSSMRAAPPTRVIVSVDGYVGIDRVCRYCAVPFSEGGEAVRFACGHGVHEGCMPPHRYVPCPACRRLQPRLDDASLTPALDALIAEAESRKL